MQCLPINVGHIKYQLIWGLKLLRYLSLCELVWMQRVLKGDLRSAAATDPCLPKARGAAEGLP